MSDGELDHTFSELVREYQAVSVRMCGRWAWIQCGPAEGALAAKQP